MLHAVAPLTWPQSMSNWVIWIATMVAIVAAFQRSGSVPFTLLGLATALFGYGIDGRLYIPLTVLAVGVLMRAVSRRTAANLSSREIVREGLLVALGFGLYEMGRKLTEGGASVAASNSLRVLDFERRLRLNFESDLQQAVLPHENAVRIITRMYSSLYLPVVIFGLVWFLGTNRSAFRVLRNTLAISAFMGLLTFWLFPVAPPRLVPAAGVVDFHVLLGREHNFVNEYAAIPSFHVGWTMLVGFMFFQVYRHHRLRWLAWIPGGAMLFTVMATGNHYWFDGAVGMLYALVPAAILLDWPRIRAWWTRWMSLPHALHQPSLVECTMRHTSALLDVAAIGALLTFVFVGGLLHPDFTDYWGYMVAQMAGTILAVMWLTQQFSAEGGLSWLTHVIIVAVTYADTLGTAAGFYDRYQVYDKITHFGGGAILAAVAYEIALALRLRGAITWDLHRRMIVAIGVSLTLGAIWEFYEVFGDAIFDTGRHAGSRDTIYDLISDFSGAILAVALLARFEPNRVEVSPFKRASGSDGMTIGRTGEPA
jgi:PAP2 superfamily protein